MFRHVFQLMLGPSRYGVDVTVCVTHEVQLVGSDSHPLGADSAKAADIDDNLTAVQMRDGANFFVVSAINGRAVKKTPVSVHCRQAACD